jgi:hypothetical protein
MDPKVRDLTVIATIATVCFGAATITDHYFFAVMFAALAAVAILAALRRAE